MFLLNGLKGLKNTYDFCNALHFLGKCYYKLGQYRKAIEQLERALNLFADLHMTKTIDFCYCNLYYALSLAKLNEQKSITKSLKYFTLVKDLHERLALDRNEDFEECFYYVKLFGL